MEREDVGVTISHLLIDEPEIVRLRAYATRRGWVIRYRTNEPEQVVEELEEEEEVAAPRSKKK